MNKLMNLSTSSTGFSTEKNDVRLERAGLSTILTVDNRYAEKVIHNFAREAGNLRNKKEHFPLLSDAM